MPWLQSCISTSIYVDLYDQYIQIVIGLDTKLGYNLIFDGSNFVGRPGLIGPHRLILVYLERTIHKDMNKPGGGGAILADAFEDLNRQSVSQSLE